MVEKSYYPIDLHIHSSLSGCASNEMTPRNIIINAKKLGLKAISLTDHNSCGNVSEIISEGLRNNILVIPGMEVESKEGVHILTFFDSLESCLKIERKVHENLPKIRNNPRLFGNQIQVKDGVKVEFPLLLSQSSDISIFELNKHVRDLGGVCVPAHIYRKLNGIISVLGFLPEDVVFNTLEISKYNYSEELSDNYNHNIVVNSDAHNLTDMYEIPTTALELEGELDTKILLRLLKTRNSSRFKFF